jgi:hypothetical protein
MPPTPKSQLSATNELQAELNEALEDIGSVKEVLSEAYTPEASRAQLVKAVSDALEILEDYEDEDEDDAGQVDASEDDDE